MSVVEKPILDVIFVSDCSNNYHRGMAEYCLDSLMKSEVFSGNYNIVFVEEKIKYDINKHSHRNSQIALMTEPFHYNRFMKAGSLLGKAEWIAMCNNDLLFDADWFSNILYAHEFHKGKVKSFGTWCPSVHPHRFPNPESNFIFGHRIAYELPGWCIVVRRELFEQMDICKGPEFWFSDNVYADELIRLGEKHCLVRLAEVTHLESQTLNTVPKEKFKQLTTDQKRLYK